MATIFRDVSATCAPPARAAGLYFAAATARIAIRAPLEPIEMPLIPLLLHAAVAAAPAAAKEKVGQRDEVSMRELLRELGALPSDAELERAVAAADAHPLGTVKNPVRVGGPAGERAYIARLRCAGGARPGVGQRSSAGVGAFGTIVDVFPLDCGAAAPGRFDLVMDMYHDEHRENRAPAGFTIDP